MSKSPVGGPAGLALDEAQHRLYVYLRFTNSIAIVDVSTLPGREVATVPLPFNPEPDAVRLGRPFLYDARLTSANGEASCSSCHVFGRSDDLAWDLGNPDASVQRNNNVQTFTPVDQLLGALGLTQFAPGFSLEHHPMKGPMLTQNLRGLANAGPMHWRGDRSGGLFRDDRASLDTNKAFTAFNVAFAGLLGRTGPLTDAQMQAFADFALQVPYPPNPVRNLDNSLNANEANGQRIFGDVRTAAPDVSGAPRLTCADCHVRDVARGFFGTDGGTTFDALTQMFKVPHLRNLYDRVGMFGLFDAPDKLVGTGDQIRGYGFLNDGFVDNLFTFLGGDARGGVFQFPGTPDEQRQSKRDLEAFLLVFDSNLLPIMGQQVTLGVSGSGAPLGAGKGETVGNRIDLLRARAAVTAPRSECDLVVRGVIGGVAHGWLGQADGTYVDDRSTVVADSQLRAFAQTSGQELTFTCVYPGGGRRMAIDRNDDGIVDGRQCGDVDGDGVAGSTDALALRRAMVGSGTVAMPEKCNVIDAAGEAANHCGIADAVVIARAASKLRPSVAQVCAAAQ